MLLELRQLHADRRGRDKKVFCRQGGAARIDNGAKISELFEVHRHTSREQGTER